MVSEKLQKCYIITEWYWYEIDMNLENKIYLISKIVSANPPQDTSSSFIDSLFVSHQLDRHFIRYGKYNVGLQKKDLKLYAKNR